MHIETINISVHQVDSSVARAFIEALLLAPALNEAQEGAAPVAAPAVTTAPKIGKYWLGQGGTYAGIARGLEGAPDYRLILAELTPEDEFTWKGAQEFAKTVVADGHTDFSVPTRFESALLYASLQDKLGTDYWHWTSTQCSEGNAWSQDFNNGNQHLDNKTSERRCRFVRRSIL